MRKDQSGISLIQGLLILTVVCLLGLAGWYVLKQSNNHQSARTINSFETCTAAGNPVLTTYPEQCSANGKTFTNSHQAAPKPPAAISQGVKGTTTLRSGDCMPSPTSYHSNCKVETYTTPSEVIIKRPVDLNNKEAKETVKTINSVAGVFEVALQPGVYNIYVMYDGTEYCNSFGGKGQDCEFTVEANKVTNYTLQINTATD